MLSARDILKNEGYSGWDVRKIASGGGLCIHSRLEIWLEETNIDSVPRILHEVAHIKYPDHSTEWADYYTALMDKYYKMDIERYKEEISRLSRCAQQQPLF